VSVDWLRKRAALPLDKACRRVAIMPEAKVRRRTGGQAQSNPCKRGASGCRIGTGGFDGALDS